jgi:lysophospholipase
LLRSAAALARAAAAGTHSARAAAPSPIPAYAGQQPADFAALARSLGQTDWPVPTLMGYFDSEGNGRRDIRYAYWAPAGGTQRGVVVHFNGRTEFIERNIDTYRDLTQRGYGVWTLDWRGQGLSARSLPELQRHHIVSFDQYVKDAGYFIDQVVHLRQASGTRILLAHSMGGQIALRYLLTDAGRTAFDKVVLSSPLLRLPRDNAAIRAGNWLKRGVGFESSCSAFTEVDWVGSFVSSSCAAALSSTPEDQLADRKLTQRYSNDFVRLARTECMVEVSRGARGPREPDLRVGCPTSAWFHAAAESTDEVIERLDELRTPILVIRTVKDYAVDNAGQDLLCRSKAKVSCEAMDSTEDQAIGHELLIEREPVRQKFLKLFDDFAARP